MRRRLVIVLAVLAAGVAAIALAAPSKHDPARASAQRFLDRYVEPDGRVVRRDQGGDTVSEGQAYGMLLAAAIGDERRFERIWAWTRRELQRGDGLFSWRWANGRVEGRDPAPDADLDTARALLVAGRRFHRRAHIRAARRIARAVMRRETASPAGRRVLVAGPWARSSALVNPSYVAPHTYVALGFWPLLRADQHVLGRLTAGGRRLPPDWGQVTKAATYPVPPPNTSEPPRYGFDAVRTPVRYAEACDATSRRLAARFWPLLRSGDAAVRDLDGRPAVEYTHPAALAGAAGAAAAAGDRGARDRLLDAADRAEAAHSSYYGAAWAGLGRVLLTTDWLRACG